MDWLNLTSNRDYKEDDQEQPSLVTQDADTTGQEAHIDSFNWPNLLGKVSALVGHKVGKNKIRTALTTWLNNLKRKHEFLLYWNLDSAVMVLQPVLLNNFSMLVSSYVIHYLTTNYEKMRVEADSIGEKPLYTLQI